MSTINSLLAQNISSLYETSGLYKTSSSSDTSTTSNASSYFGEDTLTLSSDGLSLLQSLLSAKDGELPPMPPEAFNGSTSSSADSSSTTDTAYSQENSLINADNTSETERTDYPLNLEAFVSSGLISQAQSDLIKNAYNLLNP